MTTVTLLKGRFKKYSEAESFKLSSSSPSYKHKPTTCNGCTTVTLPQPGCYWHVTPAKETLATAKLHYSKQDETNLEKSQMSHIKITLQTVGENIT